MAIEVEKEKKRKDGIEQQNYVASEGDIEMASVTEILFEMRGQVKAKNSHPQLQNSLQYEVVIEVVLSSEIFFSWEYSSQTQTQIP